MIYSIVVVCDEGMCVRAHTRARMCICVHVCACECVILCTCRYVCALICAYVVKS